MVYGNVSDEDVKLPTENDAVIDECNADENEKPPPFDDVFDIVGEVGLFQVFMYVMYVLMEGNGANVFMFFVLEIANPGWFCPDSDGINGSSADFVQGTCDASGLACANVTFRQEYTSAITEVSKIFHRCMLNVQLSFACLSGLLAVSTVMITEFLGPKWRSLATNRIGWHIGPAIMIISAYLLREWRYVSIVISVWTLPAFLVAIFFLPESARWLIQKKRYDEAEFWVKKMAMMNRRTVPNLNILIQKIGESEKRPPSKRYTYLDLFRSRSMAVMSLCVMYAWFCSSFISYGLAGRMGAFVGNLYLNLGISMCASMFVQWIICVYALNWIGRRKAYPLFMGITAICMLTVLILDIVKVSENRLPQNIVILISLVFMTGTWGASLLFSAELYPTMMRNVSTGAGNVAARIAGIMAPQVALLDMFHISVSYAVYGFFAITSSIAVYMLIPETYGRPLPEHVDDVITSRVKVKAVNSSDLLPLPELMNPNSSPIHDETAVERL
ncbi:organic cation transporter protein-like [Tubulanus polymorphus]|uniref:organic cation transporter protein-like n=1 Tax=Tubulanus polymorphus TaxID=672921 RepID=UPI003DA4A03C